ncbi:MAG: ABC transporter ATP-binding protein, partial [Candidatus Aegiribacteria sp.]|nr:ABC transporter ATP-binding protein [Candidatus Aegiribacteria sp.]
FTPLEFMTMFASMRKLDMKKDHMVSILGRVGLEAWVNVRIRNFSKGMKQRMSLALALQSQPFLLIMDEPTGGLDPAARKEIRDVILEENQRGASIFLSSHLLSEVETICDRAVILANGKIVTEGHLDDLLRTEDLFSISFSIPGTESDIPEEKKVRVADLQKTIDELRQVGNNILEVKPVYRSLEEVFLSATRGGKL